MLLYQKLLNSYSSITYIIQDTFTDTANTGLVDHTPDIAPSGSVWTANRGPYINASGQAQANNNLEGWARINSGISDCKVTGTLNTAHDCHLTARQKDTFNDQIRAYVKDNILYLEETLSANDTVIDSATCTVSGSYTVSLTVNGTSASATCNGVTVSGTISQDSGITYQGFITKGSNNTIDDFTVEAL